MKVSVLPLAPLLLAALIGGCSSEAAAPPAGPRAVPVRMSTVEAEPIQEFTEYVATLKSRRSIQLQPEVEGRVRRILVHSGDRVRAGQPLIELDPARQAALLRSQEATRVAREADLEYARQQYERMQALFKEGVVSRQQLDQAKSTLDATQAQVHALGADVREAQVRLENYTVAAPVDGVVGDIPVRVGGYVTPSTVLTTVGQNTALEAYVSVPVERAADLKMGMPVVLVDREGRKLGDSRVYFIAPQVTDPTQSVLIKTLVDNQGGNLRSDQFVRARVVWRTRQGPTAPVVAVRRLNGQPFLFVAEQDREKGALVARQRPVELGEIVGNVYPVLKGLSPGERVIVSGVQKLVDGAPVVAEPGA